MHCLAMHWSDLRTSFEKKLRHIEHVISEGSMYDGCHFLQRVSLKNSEYRVKEA